MEGLVLLLTCEKEKGQPLSCISKIDEINKRLSGQQADSHMLSVRKTRRSLPARNYCMTFLEDYPSIHVLRRQLQSGRDKPKSSEPTTRAAAAFAEQLPTKLQEIWLDVISDRFEGAFAALSSFCLSEKVAITQHCGPSDGAEQRLTRDLSALFDLKGTEFQLRGDWMGAEQSYRNAIALDGNNPEPALKLGSIYAESGHRMQAQQIYDVLCSSQTGIGLAWSLVHRASLWVSKDASGAFEADGVGLALADIEKVLEITGLFPSSPLAARQIGPLP